MLPAMIVLDGATLTLDAIARGRRRRAASALARRRRARAVVAPRARSSIAPRPATPPVYGVNTGFGSFAQTRIDKPTSTRCR